MNNDTLYGIQQNMSIGVTGITGNSTSVHLDYIQYQSGKVSDSMNTTWNSFYGSTNKIRAYDKYNFSRSTQVTDLVVKQKMINAPVGDRWVTEKYFNKYAPTPSIFGTVPLTLSSNFTFQWNRSINPLGF